VLKKPFLYIQYASKNIVNYLIIKLLNSKADTENTVNKDRVDTNMKGNGVLGKRDVCHHQIILW